MVFIRIAPPKVRAQSDSYPQDVDCKTIVHEVLHLTGLVDEYKEYDVRGEREVYPNRAIGSSNSVMASNGTQLIFGLSTQGRLYPAHIRHILFPECQEKNSLYYICAKSAYVESPKRHSKLAICKKKTWLD